MMPAALLAASGAPAALRAATVVALAGDRLVLSCEGGRAAARLAPSCSLSPSVGDEVLAWTGGEDWHVLAVLGRAAPASEPMLAAAQAEDEASEMREAMELPLVPHHDRDEDDSITEGEAQDNRPYTRIDVPLKPDDFGSGTYLRLGAYVEGEEGGLMPALEFSKSTASNTTKTAPTPDLSLEAILKGTAVTYTDVAETANEASQSSATNPDGSLKQGYLKTGDGKFVKNKAGQMELTTIDIKAKTSTSSGDGFLGKTDADVNLKVGGGMLVEIVKGQTTHVSDGDIKFSAPAGIFAVNALSGVSVTAGTASDPANISLLAYGYVKNEAKGPLSEWNYSTSEKKTYGSAKEWFYGEKYTEFHGKEEKYFFGTSTSYFLGDQINTNLAARINMTLAATLTLALGVELALNVALNLKINLAIDLAVIIGIANKTVIGTDTKIVVGSDFKYVTGMDFKWVTIDGKAFDLELKHAQLKSYLGNVLLRTGEYEVDAKTVGELKSGFFFKT